MLTRLTTFALDGLNARRVTIEVDVRPGLPSFTIVGLGDTAAREARETVRAAIINSGYEFPPRRITVNLAPASVRRYQPQLAAALAVGVLAASGQVPLSLLPSVPIVAELSLSGQLRGLRGALPIAQAAREQGFPELIVPAGAGSIAALQPVINVREARTLAGVCEYLAGHTTLPIALPAPTAPPPCSPDLSDIRGNEAAVRALIVAAAGGHHILLHGEPGSGKTMLARRLPSILPPLTHYEALEVTAIYDVAGLGNGTLASVPPFRAPHHTISAAGLVGGGPLPRPGELTLAHHGVLFLDQLTYFQRGALEALAAPMLTGGVRLVRDYRETHFPAHAQLVGSVSDSPCGFAPASDRCCCSPETVARHDRRVNAVARSFALHALCERPAADVAPAISSAEAQSLIVAARQRQAHRLVKAGAGVVCNAHTNEHLMAACGRLSADARALVDDAYRAGSISASERLRVVQVARTIADLVGDRDVQRDAVLEALSFQRHPVLPLPMWV